jgi:uncharacterized protein YdcH (DUF465 family)
MIDATDDKIEYMLQTSSEFKEFYAEHKAINKHVEKLEKKGILSKEDELELKELKKKKLLLKDTLEGMITA